MIFLETSNGKTFVILKGLICIRYMHMNVETFSDLTYVQRQYSLPLFFNMCVLSNFACFRSMFSKDDIKR